VATPATAHVTFHYSRADGDYTNWKVYSWKNYNSPSSTDVDNGWKSKDSMDSFGAVYTVTATAFSGFDSLAF
jgi:hypothetical protein